MKDENPFINKLYHYTMPVREELWESIEKQLPPQHEEKRFPFFWFLLFASTIISGALMFGILNKKTTPATHTKEFPSFSSTTNESISIEENKSTNESLHASTSADLNSNNNNQNLTTNQRDQSKTSIANEGSSSTTSSTHSTPKATNPAFNNTGANYTATPGSNNSTNTTSTNKKKSTSSPKSPKGDFNSAASSASSTSQASLNESKMQEDASVSLSNSKTSGHATDLLPLADIGELENPGVDVIGKRKIKPDPDCYRFSGVTGKYLLSVDGFAGPGFSPRSFTIADAEASSYSVARETTESNQYAWSAGARINIQLRNGLAFRLGLLYDQAGDVFDYTDTLATHSTFRIDSFWAGDGTFLYSDTTRVVIFGTLIKKIHNTYRHLDVPLLMSYETRLGKKAALMFNAGPVFNLSSSYEGQILDPMLHPRTITPGSPNELYAYKTSLGISLYFGAGLLFPLTDKISGLFEPRYLYRIKPVTIKSYPLEEHRHFAGINIGLRYYLD